MPTKPSKVSLDASSVDIINSVASTVDNSNTILPKVVKAGALNAEGVAYSTEASLESLRNFGNVISTYTPLQNAFLSTLVNRIGRVLLESKLYDNPWAMFKRGVLEYGETIEEIFVNIAKPFQYDPITSEQTVFKREIPDVRAAFHTMNYQKYYKVTVSNDQLRQAFLSFDGITNLISKIIESLYTAANYDEFITMKYLIARNALNGNIKTVSIPDVTKANSDDIVTAILKLSDDFEFMTSEYNINGVKNYSNKPYQYLIETTDIHSIVNVNTLATAFNMEKVEFMGHTVLANNFDFNKDEISRLNELFKGDSNYQPFTAAEIANLKTIQCVLCDINFFMIFDNLINMTEIYNGEGLYYNYWLHNWKTFSVSPFANACIFTTGTPAVTSVTVTPATATVAKGGSLQLSAVLAGTGIFDKSVTWSINSSVSSITDSGVLTVSASETATTITVTAASDYDSTKTGTATITVGS